MPKRLLIAAGEAADTADDLPYGVRELIDAADEVLVVTPALPEHSFYLAGQRFLTLQYEIERLAAAGV